MRRADHIKKYIEERWRDDPVVRVSFLIIDYIANNPASNSRYMTYNYLRSISKDASPSSEDLLRSTTLLSTRFAVLMMHFVFIDESGKEFVIEDQDAKLIINDGHMDHPETRDRIVNVEEHLYPFYEGNVEFLLGQVEE